MTQRHTGPSSGRLIGRDTELAEIRAALSAARAGRGAAVFVTGEPGVGRTRLAAEAVADARAADMVTVQGRVGTAGAGLPYRPLVEVVLSLARAGLVPDAAGNEPVLARLLSDPTGPGGGGPPHLAVAEAVLRLIAAAGRSHGCLVVLEDLHDADAGTTTAVEYLLDNIGQQPATLLLTAAQVPCLATDLAARARQNGSAVTIGLGALDRTGVRHLLAAELAGDPADIDPGLVERVLADSAGIPFVIKECLAQRRDAAGQAPVPPAIARSVRRRATALGPVGVAFLSTAALLGERLAPDVARRAVGCDGAESSRILRAATASYLIVPDGDGHVFRHRLVGRALCAELDAGVRAEYARRAALAVAELYPGLPGEWCLRLAELHALVGDTEEAARLYGLAAERAAGPESARRAVALLERARELLAAGGGPESELRIDILERLLDAVVPAARLDLLPGLAAAVAALGESGLPPVRRAGLHARLALAFGLAGRPTAALEHLDLSRTLCDTGQDHPDGALVDLAAAHVEPLRLAPGRLRTATESARRALDAAQRREQPALACRAMLALSRLTADGDEPAAVSHLHDVRSTAHAHQWPVLRVSADVALAALAARRDGRTEHLEIARREASRLGVRPLAHEAGFLLAVEEIRRGEFTAAGARIHTAIADATRHGLGRDLARLWLAEAIRHAHRGRRARMREALERLAPLTGGAPETRAAAHGLARAFCSLLEEQPEDAERELARALAHDAENPATGDFGRHGLGLLLGTLAGRAGRGHHTDAMAASVAGTRWNRVFVALADAVLLGREGHPAEAIAATHAALQAARPYPVARHLGLRLVAREAYDEGWGAPVDWLRGAEAYFHDADVPAVAAACRALLRRMGVSVRQRRQGFERVPHDLRRHGVTVREFEVARLLAERISNKEIAARLHISPRTVEKHVSSLLQKTGHPNRAVFARATDLANTVL
ncbi:LuxR family transcriptional regulator [Streptomyces sp. B93]|uniref:helix-turn-helix transcriptional regulator n=1 Tax=Streptomyces sp. B93 TaxID=2824875 RepID=UPI001B35BBBB|nr:LuxR family transcriptional regulator [Streptomyces sp. B93]MBQ1091339.1 AAA family ATPase [Streptomyces sp. B93]